MRQLQGTARKIFRPIVARVETIHADGRGISHLLRSLDAATPYLLLRSGNPNQGVFVHPSLFLEAPISFRPGDILRLTPEGHCLRIYEDGSDDNALFITGRCNSKCLMCPQPPEKQSTCLREELSDLLELIEPSPVALGITGGEPTYVFDDLLFSLEKMGILHPGCHIQLLTNGRTLIEYRKAKQLSTRARNLTCCIPLYSDVADIHDRLVGIPGAFDETLEGIGNLIRLNVAVEIRLVITALNYRRLPQWAEFIYRNMPDVIHVAVMGMEPLGFARTNLDLLWVEPDVYARELIGAARVFQRAGIPISIYNHQLCMLPEPLRALAVKSISQWKVRFSPECKCCTLQSDCGGFFFSALALPHTVVRPVTKHCEAGA